MIFAKSNIFVLLMCGAATVLTAADLKEFRSEKNEEVFRKKLKTTGILDQKTLVQNDSISAAISWNVKPREASSPFEQASQSPSYQFVWQQALTDQWTASYSPQLLVNGRTDESSSLFLSESFTRRDLWTLDWKPSSALSFKGTFSRDEQQQLESNRGFLTETGGVESKFQVTSLTALSVGLRESTFSPLDAKGDSVRRETIDVGARQKLGPLPASLQGKFISETISNPINGNSLGESPGGEVGLVLSAPKGGELFGGYSFKNFSNDSFQQEEDTRTWFGRLNQPLSSKLKLQLQSDYESVDRLNAGVAQSVKRFRMSGGPGYDISETVSAQLQWKQLMEENNIKGWETMEQRVTLSIKGSF